MLINYLTYAGVEYYFEVTNFYGGCCLANFEIVSNKFLRMNG